MMRGRWGRRGGRMGLGGHGEEISPDISYVSRPRRVREGNADEEPPVSTCQQPSNTTR